MTLEYCGVYAIESARLNVLDAVIHTSWLDDQQVLWCQRHADLFGVFYANPFEFVTQTSRAPGHNRPVACEQHRFAAMLTIHPYRARRGAVSFTATQARFP